MPRRFLTEIACGCRTSVAFHPEKPSILTAGTLSGQIFVWDLTGEGDDKLVGESVASSDKAHKEPVSSVSWVYNIREQNHVTTQAIPCRCLCFAGLFS